jgi:hypothetical protein
MMTEDSDLSELHDRFFREIMTSIDSGATANDASEAMLTIGVSVLMREHGPQYAAGRLRIVASMMESLAHGRGESRH